MKGARRQIYANISSRSVQQRFDSFPSGGDSKVASSKMKHTPYVFTSGPNKDKELPMLDSFSMSWKEIESEIQKHKISQQGNKS